MDVEMYTCIKVDDEMAKLSPRTIPAGLFETNEATMIEKRMRIQDRREVVGLSIACTHAIMSIFNYCISISCVSPNL